MKQVMRIRSTKLPLLLKDAVQTGDMKWTDKNELFATNGRDHFVTHFYVGKYCKKASTFIGLMKAWGWVEVPGKRGYFKHAAFGKDSDWEHHPKKTKKEVVKVS